MYKGSRCLCLSFTYECDSIAPANVMWWYHIQPMYTELAAACEFCRYMLCLSVHWHRNKINLRSVLKNLPSFPLLPWVGSRRACVPSARRQRPCLEHSSYRVRERIIPPELDLFLESGASVIHTGTENGRARRPANWRMLPGKSHCTLGPAAAVNIIFAPHWLSKRTGVPGFPLTQCFPF